MRGRALIRWAGSAMIQPVTPMVWQGQDPLYLTVSHRALDDVAPFLSALSTRPVL